MKQEQPSINGNDGKKRNERCRKGDDRRQENAKEGLGGENNVLFVR